MAKTPPKYLAVAEQIREAVRQGAPGDTMPRTQELAQTYGTTAPTITKALEHLAGDGMLVYDGEAWKVTEGLLPADMDSPAGTNADSPKADGGKPVGGVQETAEELAARIEDKAQEKGTDLAIPEAPRVLEGRVVTEHVDPDAKRALEREDVAAAFQQGKELGREWVSAEGHATKAKKALAAKLMDLRELFEHKGHPDWNGDSREYQAVVTLLYQDLGVEPPQRRAVLHHVENLKRERIPQALWGEFGVSPLTRGQRTQLGKKAGKASDEVSTMSKALAGQAAKGKATGHQMVTLAKHIDQGMAVFTTTSLRVMTSKQRAAFRDEVKAARDQADALLRELEGLEE
ncbi:GntR family transcriptional regulator [Streptomyces sp. WAC 06783]|uniref:GntR family transcriptional regulator n=1 Tax=Streptomyces sp. WAC 06783 TaxID=2203211 RepID=UPI000F7410E1|nr:GntR family transcriptional regulator [Streptomyces sp. WAC 06783]